MKINIKKLKNCKRVIEVKLSPEKVKSEFDGVYKDIQKAASVPGYRTGNVPRDLLELHYGKTAKDEMLKKLVPQTYAEALEEHKLDPIGYPDISDVKLDIKEGFSYKATLEIRPEFSLKPYKGLKLKKKDVEVKEEDVSKSLESLREANAQHVPKEGSEEKEKVLPQLDDNFARDMGFETLDKLKDAVRESLKDRLESEARADLEMQAINQLVEGVNCEIPDSLVHAEKERLMKDAGQRIEYIRAIQKKQSPDKEFSLTEKDKKELEENSGKQAIRQVKAFFVLDRIAGFEKIYITDAELEKRVEELAAHYGKTKDYMKKHMEKNHVLDEIALSMRNAKVVEFLLREAKIS